MLSTYLFSRANHYRRLAIAARQRAAQSGDRPCVKASFEEVANHWIALADQVEWLEQSSPAMNAMAQGPQVWSGE
jgi:hypothetical protein